MRPARRSFHLAAVITKSLPQLCPSRPRMQAPRSLCASSFRISVALAKRLVVEGRPLCRPTNLLPACRGVQQTSFLLNSPSQDIQLALIRPLIGRRYEAGTHWVLHHVFPFLIVIFSSAQLRVPEMALAYRRVLWVVPMPRGIRFPILHR